jgi:hypothetical protein
METTYVLHGIKCFSTQQVAVVSLAIFGSAASLAQGIQVLPTLPPPNVQLSCSDQALNDDYSITLNGFNVADVTKQTGFPRLNAVLSQNLQQLANLANRTNDGVIEGNITGIPTLQLIPKMSIIRAWFDGNGNLTSKEASVLDSTMSHSAPGFSPVANGSYTVAYDCTVTIYIGSYPARYAITGVMVDGAKKIHGIGFIPWLPVSESVLNSFAVEAERM